MSMHAKETWTFFLKTWVKVLGAPAVVITDGGTELTGKDFQVGKLGCYHYVIDAKAPRQNGRTERAGAELKRQLALMMEEAQSEDLAELDECIAQAVCARNQHSMRAGFTPL